MPKINSFKFFFSELKLFICEMPSLILLILTFVAGIMLVIYGNSLSEFEKAIYGGLTSSLIFYIFIDFLPRISVKKQRVLRYSAELKKCLDNLNHVFENLKSEWPNFSIVEDKNKFFQILKNQSNQYMPNSNQLKIIKNTSIDQNGNNVFIYSNLGDVLSNHYYRLQQAIERLDRVAAATQLEVWSFESQIEIGTILERKSSIYRISNIQHIGNTAALLGTDFDILDSSIMKLKNRLEEEFFIKF